MIELRPGISLVKFIGRYHIAKAEVQGRLLDFFDDTVQSWTIDGNCSVFSNGILGVYIEDDPLDVEIFLSPAEWQKLLSSKAVSKLLTSPTSLCTGG